MATATQWLEGARPRTLPAALAPVAVGTGAAVAAGSANVPRALLALVVSLALQVGVNYANDYSDGMRGTDDVRVGPLRLTGSGAARPAQVRAAAFAAFGVAAAAGLALAWLAGWWLLLLGGAAIAAAWGYTGGANPYGYRGLGEVSVFVFFGLVAVMGTTFVQVGGVTLLTAALSVPVGALACALLVVNNLRDRPHDATAGKRTLAVSLGDRGTRRLYTVLLALPFVVVGAVAAFGRPGALLGLAAAAFAVRPLRVVASGAQGPALIPVLRDTGRTQLAFGLLVALGVGLG